MENIKINILFLLCLSIGPNLFGQSAMRRGINFQAVARDVNGLPLTKQALLAKISLEDPTDDGEVHYLEIHELATDHQGYFQLEIGKGKVLKGEWENIPWAKQPVWLSVEINNQGDNSFSLINRTAFKTVPYAINAKTAHRIASEKDINLRENYSITWNTSGNFKTEPNVHFVGTRDTMDLYLKTNNVTRMDFGVDGELTIYADSERRSPPQPETTLYAPYYNYFLQNNEEDTAAYALVLRGKEHGVYIEVDTSRSNATNFVTFVDKDNKVHGNIEGYTKKELTMSQDWKIDLAIYIADLTLTTAVTAAEYAQGVGFAGAAGASAFPPNTWKVPGFLAASGSTIGLGAAASADLVKKIIERQEQEQYLFETIGVSFSSGAADYAEYLKRSPLERDLFPGEVVGVKNGMISLNTSHADHIMVVSEHPAFLGNMPTPEKMALFEKVAFMGQVKVKVLGPVRAGDYILPSGNNDGLGVAKPANELSTLEFKNILGVAWEEAITQADKVNIVNVGVGLNQNDLTPKVEQLEKKVDNILAYLKGEEALKGKNQFEEVSASEYTEWSPSRTSSIPEQQLVQLLEQSAPEIKQFFQIYEEQALKQGINLRSYEGMTSLLDHPVEEIKQLINDPKYKERWKYIMQKSN